MARRMRGNLRHLKETQRLAVLTMPAKPEHLGAVRALLTAAGLQPHNVDATVVAEAPKLGPQIPGMRANLAKVLGVPETQVNVKGTTAKGMGWLGAGEGIACLAVATVTAARPGPVRQQPPRGGAARRQTSHRRLARRGSGGRD